MHHLVITPSANTDKNDYTGAFKPEAAGYIDFWKKKGDTATLIEVNNTLPFAKRYDDLLKKFRATSPARFENLAVFCHGWSSGIQIGLSVKTAPERAQFESFMKELSQRMGSPNPKISLYCCSTGKDARETKEPNTAPGTGDNSFADQFRDALCRNGMTNCTVFAHSTAGHTVQNPDIRYFLGMGSPIGGIGGITPVQRRTPEYKALRKLLDTPERFRMAFFTIAELHDRLLHG